MPKRKIIHWEIEMTEIDRDANRLESHNFYYCMYCTVLRKREGFQFRERNICQGTTIINAPFLGMYFIIGNSISNIFWQHLPPRFV